MHAQTRHDLNLAKTRWRAPDWRGCALSLAVASLTFGAAAGPQGGEVIDGSGHIGRAGNGTTVINQLSDRIAIDWDSFNIAADERVVFQQPTSTSTALNRIFDQNPSQIFGAIDANGRILLINPNGMLFGESARLNIQSLVATSLELSLDDFKAGRYDLKALADSQGGAIINRGLIQAASGGSVSLVGSSVVNDGLIVADYGQVNLAAGTQATLDFDGDGMLLFSVDSVLTDNVDGVDSAVSNTGAVQADGGQVLMAANAARDVFSSVVNNEGRVRAMRVDNRGGVIRLTGGSGTVLNTGELDASSATGVGGRIAVEGERVGIFGDAIVNASGRDGGGVVQIGGGRHGTDQSIDNAQYTYVGSNTEIRADATRTGDGGEVIVWSDVGTKMYGEISARGGELGGDGGFVETSGKVGLVITEVPDVTASRGAGGEWLIDPFDIEIVPGGASSGIDTPDAVSFDTDGTQQPAQLGVDLIEAALTGGANVTVMTTAGGDPGDLGDITLTAGTVLDFNGTGSNTLTLDALNNIIITGDILDTVVGGDSLNLDLQADNNIRIDAAATVDLGVAGVLSGTGVDFNNFGAVTTPGGVSLVLSGSFANTGSIVGSGVFGITANDAFSTTGTLDANGAAVNVTLTGPSTVTLDGTIDGGGGLLTTSVGADVINVLSNVDIDITTGDGNDTVNLQAAVTGDIDVGDNDNVVSFGASGAVAGTLSAGTGDNTLNGADVANTWAVNGAGTGSLNGTDFSGFDNLQGGSVVDAFTLGAAGSVTTLDGGAGSDTLTGPDADTTWTISGADAGTAGGQGFTSIESLIGGDSVDTFNLNAALTGTITGGGGNDAITIGAVGSAASFDGGADSDTLTADDSDHVWIVDAVDSGTLDGVAFASIESIVSGAGNDSLTGPDAVTAWLISALNAGTVGAIAFAGIESVIGGTGVDTFTLGATGAVTTLTGGGGSDFLVGPNATRTWTVNAADAGTVGTQAFTSIENLTGGTAADVFNVNAALTGAINGGNGGDTINIGASGDAASYDGGGGTDTLVGDDTPNVWVINADDGGTLNGDTFSNVENLVGGTDTDDFTLVGAGRVDDIDGGDGTDTLTGADIVTAWLVSALNEGTINGDAFSAIENLNGGAAVDTFVLSATLGGTLDAGDGTDTITVNTGGSATLVDGGADADTLIAANDANNWVINGPNGGTLDGQDFARLENLQGGSGVDTFTLAGGSASTLIGGGGSDELIGRNVATTWTVVSNNGGTVGTQAFDAIENLTGGSDVDTFNILAALDGAISGNAGDDVISLGAAGSFGSADGGANNDTLTAGNINNTWQVLLANGGELNGATFSNVENLQGGTGVDVFTLGAAGSATTLNGGAGNDALVGPNTGVTWTVTGADAGTVGTQGFAAIENLTGGSGNDVFNINNTVTGDVSGGAGNDTFALNAAVGGNLNGGLGNDIVNLAVTGGATTIDGGANTDTLNAPDTSNSWAITADNGGTLNGEAFSNVENLVGGSLDDGFTYAGLFDVGSLDGGAGDDTLTASAAANDFEVTGGNAGTFNTDPFAGIENLIGGGGSDTFTLNVGATVVTLTGGAGDDTLFGPDADVTWVVSGADAGSVAGQAFTAIENLSGGTGVDTFDVNAALSGDIDGGAGNDIVTLDGAVAGNVVGGGGDDAITLGTGSAGFIDGGANDDTLTAGDAGNTWTVDAVNRGTVNGIDFSNVENAVSGSGDDTFDFDVGAALTTLDGGAGNDTINGADQVNDFNVTADDAGTLNALTAFVGIENLNGGDDVDVFTLAGTLTGDVTGGAGGDLFIGAGGGAASIDGGAGLDDALQGPDTGVTVTVTGPDTLDFGPLASIGPVTSVEQFVGGSGDDTFNIPTDYDFSLDGGGGNDTFNLTSGVVTGDLLGNGGDDTFNVSGGTAASIDGGSGNDTLNGLSLGGIWVINALNGGTIDGQIFTDIENGVGSAGQDSFTFLVGGSIESLDGGLDTDSLIAANDANTFVLTGMGAGTLNGDGFIAIENLTGGDADDTFTLAAAADFMLLDGGGGSDELIGPDSGIAWLVDVMDEGTAGGQDFVSMENLTGGAGNDTFVINATLSGFVNAAGGADSITLAAVVAGAVQGGAGDDQITVDTGGSAASFDGGADGDTLIGSGADDLFLIDAANAGDLNGVAFANVETVDGAAGNDQFTFDTAGSLDEVRGAVGDDTLIGANQANAFAITGVNAGTLNAASFTDVENLQGGTAVDTFTLGATGSVTTLDGGAGSDELIGPDAVLDWLVSSLDAGTAGSQAFGSIENLTGGSMADTFTINAGLTGDINAGGGNDSVVLNAAVGGVINTQAGADAIVLGSMGSVASIDGGADTDTLTGNDTGGSFIIDSANGGTLDGTVFANIENAAGGSGDDTFTLVAGGSVASIDGGGQINGDTLVGDDQINTFVVDAANAGTLNGAAFTDIENLTGGALEDTFAINGALSGTAIGLGGEDVFTLGATGSAGNLDGGADSDTLNGADAATNWTILTATTGTAGTQAFANMETLNGGAAADVFNVNASFAGDINAGAGNDVFLIAAGFAGAFDGGAGADQFTLTAAFNGATGSIDGGADADTLTGFDTANAWLIDMFDAGTLNGQSFSGVENLIGGGAVDTFAINAEISGQVRGGAGDDVFTLADDGAAGAMGIFGDAGADTLNVAIVGGGRDVDFDGGADADTVVLTGGSAAARLDGQFDAATSTVTYDDGGATHSAVLTNVEMIDDQVFAETLGLTTADSADVTVSAGSAMASGSLAVDLGVNYDFSNKNSLALVASNAAVMLVGAIDMPDTLDIDAAAVSSDGGTISAMALIIQNAMIMSALNTGVDFLTLSNVSGNFAIADEDALELLASTITGAGASASVTANGDLTVAAGETVSSTGALALASTTGSVLANGDLSGTAVSIDSASALQIGGQVTGTQSVALTSASTIGQAPGSSITTPSLVANSVGGLNLGGLLNRFISLVSSNTGGNTNIVNTGDATATVTNTGGGTTVTNSGTLTLAGLTTTGGPTRVTAGGNLNLTGDVMTGGLTELTAASAVNQSAAINASGDVLVQGNTIVVTDAGSATSTNGDVTYSGQRNITINDVTASNGAITLFSRNGDILATRNGSTMTSNDITFSGLRLVGEADKSFSVVGNDGVLTLTSPTGVNPLIPLFIQEQPGAFVSIGPRSGSAVNLALLQANSVFGQGLSATLSTGTAIDSSVFETELEVVGKVGRGVSIPCDQVEDEEEACQ